MRLPNPANEGLKEKAEEPGTIALPLTFANVSGTALAAGLTKSMTNSEGNAQRQKDQWPRQPVVPQDVQDFFGPKVLVKPR